jgi:hypothetical protein
MAQKAIRILILRVLAIIILHNSGLLTLKAQILSKIFKIDTTNLGFYETYDTITNNRVYTSQKLTSPTLYSEDGKHRIKYLSNGNTNLGVGTTYEWFTLNIAVNFRFINDDDDEKGKTRFLDLQTHIIGRPYIVNLYGQFYRGVYLWPETGKNPPGVPYEQRPDIRTRLMGGSVYFVPNWRRFSFAAAITQRDWQKKSAGSPLYGIEAFYGNMTGDSSLIPEKDHPFFKRSFVDRLSFLEAGVGGGYGYTLVVWRHFFVHASATAGAALGYFHEGYQGAYSHDNLYIRPNFLIRSSIGYNSNKFNCAAYYQINRNFVGNDQITLNINTSNLRFILAYRLPAGPKTKKVYYKILNKNKKWKKDKEEE